MTLAEMGAAADGLQAADRVAARSSWSLTWRRLRRDGTAIASATAIIGMLLVAICAPLIQAWYGISPGAQDRLHGRTPTGLAVGPNSTHWFGTDRLGTDLFINVVYGARTSLFIGLSATAIAVVLGIAVGTCAGYFGGVVDGLLARLMDVVLSFPYVLTAVALVSVFGPHLVLTIGIIGCFSWATLARIIRGQVLALRDRGFIQAARSLGAGPLRIMVIDILPNLMAPVTVIASMTVPAAVLIESTLDFLGAGDPTSPSWGNLIKESTLTYQVAWWTLFFPAAALLITTLSFNLFGDAVRDALDPRGEQLLAQRQRLWRRGLRKRVAR